MATHCSAVTTLAPYVTPSPTRHSANSLCLVWAAHRTLAPAHYHTFVQTNTTCDKYLCDCLLQALKWIGALQG